MGSMLDEFGFWSWVILQEIPGLETKLRTNAADANASAS